MVQEGCRSTAALFVILVWPLPSAFMTHMSVFPSRSEWKATLVPSGDQAGEKSRWLTSEVSDTPPVPSAFGE